ncbi:deoxyribonuclease IV [Paenibacillus polymyxa]|uniref:deoxyribonuclease IV n=1 Tax=Paenibacillus polymyxa TaxID=1406 RepID=UPI002AB5AF1D|nr:deoxyribonuclease IV [Paenibacillus polymyxa]MDY8049575.1 deoxyribonuclease IV [Paenibacillus polymyxa]
MMPKLLIGSHVSTRGGFSKAAMRAREQGGRSFQYFPKNPRSLRLKEWSATDAAACNAYCLEHQLQSIAHSPYPVNAAHGSERGQELYELTIASLRNDLDIAEACGSKGIVVHFGHMHSLDPLEGYRNIINCFNDVLEGWLGNAKILIENQAGDHGPMGTTLEEMVQIRQLCRYPDSIGFCLDTCHAYAAGLWNGGMDEALIEKGNRLGYWSALCGVHLNDSKYPYGSKKDRHARVGQGYIGTEGMRWMTDQEAVRGIPIVLESETGPDGTHQEDIQMILSWE